MTLAVVDYGAGNLRSVGGALDVLGAAWRLAKGPEDLEGAPAVLLPGVGSAGSAMRELERRGFPSALREPARPLLGICLGLQLLFERSEEEGGVRCLGILPGRVRRLEGAPRLPHMGWNRVRPIRPHALFPKADPGEWFYFAHSYLCECPAELTLAATTHGETFASAIGEGAVCGVQFHPEKSGAAGLRLLAGFLSGAGVATAAAARSTGTG
ncbi:MAG TPA: imidazole glycerol phosphate synthase subunit HisH [Gemmatimonadota bacterium]|jgi:glutamine amidotransferase